MAERRGDVSEAARGALRTDKIRNFVVADLQGKSIEFPPRDQPKFLSLNVC